MLQNKTLSDHYTSLARTPINWMPANHWQALGLLSAYNITFTALWWASVNLEIMPKSISWFMPAGLRVFCLMTIAPRGWGILWAGEIVANVNINSGFDYSHPWHWVTGIVLPFLTYALPFYGLRLTRLAPLSLLRISPALVFAAAMVSALLASLLLTHNLMQNGFVQPEAWPQAAVEGFLGDLTGTCLGMPLIYIFKRYDRRPGRLLMVVGLALAALTLASALEPDGYGYYLKFMLAMPVALAIQYSGIGGASLTLWFINCYVFGGQVLHHSLGPTEQDQFYIIAITLAGLTLGHAVTINEQLKRRMHGQNTALRSANTRLAELNDQYRDLATRLVNTEEAERRRFSRDVHDGLGQLLSAAQLKCQTVRRSQDGAQREETLEELGTVLSAAYKTARELMLRLAPDTLLKQGLRAALGSQELSSGLKDRGIDLHIEITADERRLSSSQALHIYRIVQECIQNILRHAHASVVRVALREEDDMVVLEVSDNGKDADLNHFVAGLGLGHIRDRTSLMRGEHALSVSDQGVCHTVRIPAGAP